VLIRARRPLNIKRTGGANHKISLAIRSKQSNRYEVEEARKGARPIRQGDATISEFFGPARLAPGPGLAVVTATAPFQPRGQSR